MKHKSSFDDHQDRKVYSKVLRLCYELRLWIVFIKRLLNLTFITFFIFKFEPSVRSKFKVVYSLTDFLHLITRRGVPELLLFDTTQPTASNFLLIITNKGNTRSRNSSNSSNSSNTRIQLQFWVEATFRQLDDLRELRQQLSSNSLGQCLLSSSNDLRDQDLSLRKCPECTDEDTTIYAIKRLRKELHGETKLSGAIDLSRLSHSHIVNLHGTGCAEPGSANFYIIIEQVQSTLSDAITVFRRQRERLKLVNICRNGVRLDKKGKAAELRNDFNRRVDIARQLASALQYLHENS